MFPQIIISAVVLVVLAFAGIVFKYYNKKHFPLCTEGIGNDGKDYSPCSVCGVTNADYCKLGKNTETDKEAN